MVQILQPQPSTRTLRQQAFQQGVDQIGQGIAGFADASEKQTQRQLALKSADEKNAIDFISFKEKEGLVLSPEEEQFKQSIISRAISKPPQTPGFFSNLFGADSVQEEPQNISADMPGQVPLVQKPGAQSAQPSGGATSYGDLSRYTPKRQAEIREQMKKSKLLDLQLQSEMQKANQTPLEKLPADQKTKVGFAKSALANLAKMEKLVNEGYEPRYITPKTGAFGVKAEKFVSSDPYLIAAELMNEDIGRLQSQGAVTDDEWDTFRGMDPTPGDNIEARKAKIQAKKEWLQMKLQSLGVGDQPQPYSMPSPTPTPYAGNPNLDPKAQAELQELKELEALANGGRK